MKNKLPWMKGRDGEDEGKGLFKCLWCFLVIFRRVDAMVGIQRSTIMVHEI